MIRRPPRSTPFPTRRSSDLKKVSDILQGSIQFSLAHRAEAVQHALQRSEEHTSELQSQSNLVCRLLLEKKKYSDLRCVHVIYRLTVIYWLTTRGLSFVSSPL